MSDYCESCAFTVNNLSRCPHLAPAGQPMWMHIKFPCRAWFHSSWCRSTAWKFFDKLKGRCFRFGRQRSCFIPLQAQPLYRFRLWNGRKIVLSVKFSLCFRTSRKNGTIRNFLTSRYCAVGLLLEQKKRKAIRRNRV